MILNMGPMYHILEERKRYSVIEQCMEKLKEDGILVVAFIPTILIYGKGNFLLAMAEAFNFIN